MFDVIGKRRWFYALSALLTIPGLIFILISPFSDAGLQLTIDFTGGTRWEIKFADPAVTPAQVEEVFAENDLDAVAIRTGTGFIEIKTEPIGLQAEPAATTAPSASPSGSAGPSGSPGPSASADASPSPSVSASPRPSGSPVASGTPAPSASASPGASASPSASPSTAPVGNTQLPTDGKLGEMVTALEAELGPIESQASLTTIGAVVSSDLLRQALILIVVGSLAIVGWITYRFRDVKFGVTALVSLGHDVIVVVGAFAILGTFFNVEVDALFVTAMLTVIGFSVHDTIVVFDRVRENKARHLGEPFDEIVNHSILQTFARSILTSLTVLLTLLALFLFGGSAISDFVLALLIGIMIGTYSSIFVAAQVLLLFGVKRGEEAAEPTKVGPASRPSLERP
ncbi:MAG TPA: protein translocase subunit SecF, partial [Actinomycetota bacterium]|nr:protein translocase subunit SecF [Actinomycetota bacterium]